ncbi:cupredoxin domain-containing protein [uncultured Methanoregula sp.]|uniref:cupredoxin domain-containing protein n=1 Tax=uncultured Methanoregula sp. TaxID=1005933 RepID=UPI002AAAE65A|nr:cupredoxin domain-containing protein [uncultured Methanoregula sp.]
MKHAIVILVIVAMLAIAAGCSQPAPAQQPPSTPTPAPVTSRAPSATYLPTTTVPVPVNTPSVSDNTITISKMTFNPSQIKVKAGANIRWANEDSVIHRIKFADDTQSPILAVGQSYTRAFETPGVYDYTCSIHPSMQGTIIVE